MPWRPTRFRELVEKLLGSFSALGFERGAVLYHRTRGVDGSAPSENELRAIQAAVRFAALDANDDVIGTHSAGHQLATSENGALVVQVIDEVHARVVQERGGALRRNWTLGMQVGAEPSLPDAVVPVMTPIKASQRLARSVFNTCASSSGRRRRRMRIAVEWHAAALSNPHAVTLQQRLIALKTGFESLLGTSNSRVCGRYLRQLFERVAAPHVTSLPWGGVLWSPKERIDLVRTRRLRDGNTELDTRSELEDWFMTLAEARNQIIHDGELRITEYEAPRERPLSRYAGQLFWRGERLLREAVKASLGAEVLLEGLLAREAELKELSAPLLGTWVDNDESEIPPTHDQPSETEILTGPPRSCDQLLAALACDAANRVVLSKATGGTSASPHAAQESARRLQGYWVASIGDRSMLISSAERDLLEGAGAEMKLRTDFKRCE